MVCSNIPNYHHRPSLTRQILNTILCILFVFVAFGIIRKHHLFSFPITIEAICQISLGELNRRKSKKRVQQLRDEEYLVDVEKKVDRPSDLRYLASVVGYREEPALFAKCLESYKGNTQLEMLLIGIDGNEARDLEMVTVVRKVFPDATFLNLDETLASFAVQSAEDHLMREPGAASLPEDWAFDDLTHESRTHAGDFAMCRVYDRATKILEAHDILYSTSTAPAVICITQPHLNKKGIMFTNLVFSIVLGKANALSYLWTSDSDTWVLSDTLSTTIGCMAKDPKVGGSCSLLGIHNGHESVIALLGQAIYWTELAITRGQTGAIDAADCQPGPCAAFLLDALESNLFAWYTQTSLGVKTVVNEDRHLTTLLLLKGWKVTFNTEVMAYTDTPTTLTRWITQQIRWARATQIETFQYPRVYAIHGPIFLLSSMNRFYGPLSVLVFTTRYVLTGDVIRAYSIQDILMRVVLVTTYNLLCYRRQSGCTIAFLAVSQLFYQLPLPGLIIYATFTALEGGWGTAMRNQKDVLKEAQEADWRSLRAIMAVAAWLAIVAAAFGRWLANSFVPDLRSLFMIGFAISTMIVFFYTTLIQSRGR